LDGGLVKEQRKQGRGKRGPNSEVNVSTGVLGIKVERGKRFEKVTHKKGVSLGGKRKKKKKKKKKNTHKDKVCSSALAGKT